MHIKGSADGGSSVPSNLRSSSQGTERDQKVGALKVEATASGGATHSAPKRGRRATIPEQDPGVRCKVPGVQIPYLSVFLRSYKFAWTPSQRTEREQKIGAVMVEEATTLEEATHLAPKRGRRAKISECVGADCEVLFAIPSM